MCIEYLIFWKNAIVRNGLASLKMLAFSLKLEIRLLLTNNGWIIGFFAINESLHYRPIRFVRNVWVVSFFCEVVVKVFFLRFNYVC